MATETDNLQTAYPRNSGFEKWFRMPDAAQLSVKGINKSSLAVTEIRYDRPDYGAGNSSRHESADNPKYDEFHERPPTRWPFSRYTTAADQISK